ncbi:acyl carrier protein [Dactylosporangium sp. NPDC050588]|uniref:acyl carrier protein n=1 Tax=Dactylosporangium sp. NPDC050588 TaxID=3157211 RepID=UPI0033F1EDAE
MTEQHTVAVEPTAGGIRTWLVGRVAHYLDETPDAIDPHASLAGYGLDSVYAFALSGEIEDTLRVTVEPTLIWDVASIADLTDRIVALIGDSSAG